MEAIKAKKRDLSIRPKHLRRDGHVPGVLFGKSLEESISVQFDVKDVSNMLKTHSADSTLTVTLNRKKYPTLIREIKYLHLSTEVEHISLQVLVSDEPVNSNFSIIVLNRDLVRGVLETPTLEIAYKALPADLLESVEVDLAGMKPGDIIRLEDLPISKNESLEIHTPLDTVIASVSELKAVVDDELEGDELADDGEAAEASTDAGDSQAEDTAE